MTIGILSSGMSKLDLFTEFDVTLDPMGVLKCDDRNCPIWNL